MTKMSTEGKMRIKCLCKIKFWKIKGRIEVVYPKQDKGRAEKSFCHKDLVVQIYISGDASLAPMCKFCLLGRKE